VRLPDAQPELAESDELIRLYARDIMWQKERLLKSVVSGEGLRLFQLREGFRERVPFPVVANLPPLISAMTRIS